MTGRGRVTKGVLRPLPSFSRGRCRSGSGKAPAGSRDSRRANGTRRGPVRRGVPRGVAVERGDL